MIGPAGTWPPAMCRRSRGPTSGSTTLGTRDSSYSAARLPRPWGPCQEELVQDKGGAGANASENTTSPTRKTTASSRTWSKTPWSAATRRRCVKMEDLDGDGIVLGRVDRSPYQKCLIELVGPEKFLVDLHTEPGPALELKDAIDSQLDRSFELIVRSDVEIIGQPDNVTADMTPHACVSRILPALLPEACGTGERGLEALRGTHGRANPSLDGTCQPERLRCDRVAFPARHRRRSDVERSPRRPCPAKC